MINQGLTERLSALAEYVKAGHIIADIGTDHAYLPIYLVKTGKCPGAIACDINIKPLEAASTNVKGNGLEAKIELRLGDGLQIIMPGEVQTVVIAGMGGNTIVNILKLSPGVLLEADQLVLQPMGDEEGLRRWLITNGWCIADETLTLEDGKLYTIILSVKGEEALPGGAILEIGPRLVEKKHPLLPLLLKKLLDKYEHILKGLSKSSQSQLVEKKQRIEARLSQIQEVANLCR